MFSLAVYHHLYPANLLMLSIVREEFSQAPSHKEASMEALIKETRIVM